MSTNSNHNGQDAQHSQDAQPAQDTGGLSENFRKLPIAQNRLNGERVGVSERQRAAIELLAIGKSLGTVARLVQIDPRTLYNWRQSAAFREALAIRRRQLWSTAIQRVRGMVNPSLDIVEQHLSDRYERIRFRAAQTVLNLASLKKHASEADEAGDDEPGDADDLTRRDVAGSLK
jgi:hypothetical protein